MQNTKKAAVKVKPLFVGKTASKAKKEEIPFLGHSRIVQLGNLLKGKKIPLNKVIDLEKVKGFTPSSRKVIGVTTRKGLSLLGFTCKGDKKNSAIGLPSDLMRFVTFGKVK